uniref:Uncharacterized protein n=1 Tax=Malurus cyaneus samueli TaxID=2593467 RepID=A0A8C5X2E3_9PASS
WGWVWKLGKELAVELAVQLCMELCMELCTELCTELCMELCMELAVELCMELGIELAVELAVVLSETPLNSLSSWLGVVLLCLTGTICAQPCRDSGSLDCGWGTKGSSFQQQQNPRGSSVCRGRGGCSSCSLEQGFSISF